VEDDDGTGRYTRGIKQRYARQRVGSADKKTIEETCRSNRGQRTRGSHAARKRAEESMLAKATVEDSDREIN
jgi:hypothetical protein